jgi:mono/diheme cytochrome c family protein
VGELGTVWKRVVFAAAAVLLFSLGFEGRSTAQEAPAPKSIWDGAFTEAQAMRGQERYRKSCAACHAEDLLGATGPALVGQAFMDRWNGQTALDIVQTIKQTMPQEAPDSLGLSAYVDIISYLLKSNGSPAGTSELPSDNDGLRRILVSSHAPGR